MEPTKKLPWLSLAIGAWAGAAFCTFILGWPLYPPVLAWCIVTSIGAVIEAGVQ